MPFDLAEALPYTCLSLGRYARIMGVTPPHFWQAYTPALSQFPLAAESATVWFQHSWQAADRASREDLAYAIDQAEHDIADALGYWPCPKWITNEPHRYPRHYNRQAYGFGFNVRGQFKSIPLKYAKLITPGQRATTLIATPTVAGGTLTYSDEDGDGFSETATVTAATSLTDACELKVYFADQGGVPGWEIRPWRSKSISGGTVTFTFDSWLFINPELFETYPTAIEGNSPIDISTTDNYVTSCEVRREYTDTTAKSAEFFWERQPSQNLINGLCGSCGGVGCVACSLITQDGCLHIRDVDRGLAVPTPSTYDSDNAQWNIVDWTECREPDQVKLWYRAGDLSEQYLADQTCDPLSNYWARAIAWLATARLERSFCATSNATQLAEQLQIDLAIDQPASFTTTPAQLDNPFGTRRGEVQAWQWVSRFSKQLFKGYAV